MKAKIQSITKVKSGNYNIECIRDEEEKSCPNVETFMKINEALIFINSSNPYLIADSLMQMKGMVEVNIRDVNGNGLILKKQA